MTMPKNTRVLRKNEILRAGDYGQSKGMKVWSRLTKRSNGIGQKVSEFQEDKWIFKRKIME